MGFLKWSWLGALRNKGFLVRGEKGDKSLRGRIDSWRRGCRRWSGTFGLSDAMNRASRKR